MTSSETGHNYSYDLLRIIAILCVIFNHTKQYGYELYTVASDPYSRYGSLLLGMVCKIGVPLFLMVSGTLLLGRGVGTLNACIVYVLLMFLACAVLVWIGRKIPGVRFLLHS